ncbi:MAG TPA: S16 family serine protease [Ktedonobacteraceae bacterium]|nr:S16 family serine protease [Ktedonobacteraceae bacterium]
MQATKGDGKIIPLGLIQRVMRESIDAVVQYVRFKSVELNLSQDWYENLDVAVLATYMGVPKEGSSAGITIVTGIVSALKKQPVRNDIAMTGEITIMGRYWLLEEFNRRFGRPMMPESKRYCFRQIT